MALDLVKNDNTLLYFLNNNARKIYRKIITDTESGETGLATQRSVQDVMADAQNLKELINSEGTTLRESIGDLEYTMTSNYVTTSVFGEAKGELTTQIQQTAGLLTEAYSLLNVISTVTTEDDGDGNIVAVDAMGQLNKYMTFMSGQIRRGFIRNPDYPTEDPYNEFLFGIAISQSLEFEGEETAKEEEGQIYYELSSGQTFGFYTATGWQFWINGVRRGWFKSEDGMLHVAQIVAEQSFQLGKWEISVVDSQGNDVGLGLRYVGS